MINTSGIDPRSASKILSKLKKSNNKQDKEINVVEYLRMMKEENLSNSKYNGMKLCLLI